MMTTELFAVAGYAVTITNHEVILVNLITVSRLVTDGDAFLFIGNHIIVRNIF